LKFWILLSLILFCDADEIHDLAADIKKVSLQLEVLNERSLQSRHKITASNVDHGESIYNSLCSTKDIEDAPEGDGPAIISPALMKKAKDLFDDSPRPHEQVLVNLYTPSLIDVVGEVNPGLRLVNSECYQWLKSPSGNRKLDLKPGLFSAHHSLVQFCPAYKNAPACDVQRLFGKFISWESRASIHCIWDAKWKIDMRAFGEKCKYLQIAGEDCKDHNGVALKMKGVLFDVTEFWMIRSSGNTITNVVKCQWTQSGSKQRLVEFLRVTDPWLHAANAMCERFNVTILDMSASEHEQSAFLGAGANGRVFKLNTNQVMKVVVGQSRIYNVEVEYRKMLTYLECDGIQSVVFPVVNNSYCSGFVDNVPYAGYLLAQEGNKIALPLSNERKTELVRSLYVLHSHSVIHGDPRIDNALILDGTLKWIDFRQSEMVTSKVSRRNDVSILYESMTCGLATGVAREDIEAYADAEIPSLEMLREVFFK
jgi:hypothetical protein